MNEKQTELAQQLVACKHWRWMDGMFTACKLRVCEGGKGYVIGDRSAPTRDSGGWYDGDDAGLIPDLGDPATIGCLLALARGAWVDEALYAKPPNRDCTRWRAFTGQDCAAHGDTEAEALAAALLGAP
jgi:hypothetical protein